jgi:sugar lactone lactonase YvrE
MIDAMDNIVRRVSPNGDVETLAGMAGECGREDGHGSAARFCRPMSLAIDASGNLYVLDAGNGLIRKVSPTDDVTTIATISDPKSKEASMHWLARPNTLVRTPDGTLYVFGSSETSAERVVRIAPDGSVQAVAGGARR